MSAIGAVALDDNSRSANSVAKKFGIPLRTLVRRVQKNKLTKSSLGFSGRHGKGNEQKLVKYIKKLEEMGYAPTSNDIRHLEYTFSKTDNIMCNFNEEKQLADDDWFNLFMKR